MILSLSVLVMAIGCSDGPDVDGPALGLEGTWAFSSFTSEGVSYPASDWFNDDQEVRWEMTFNADGTVNYSSYDVADMIVDTGNETYTISGSTVTITDGGGTDIFNWSITGSTLKLSFMVSDTSVEWFLTRN